MDSLQQAQTAADFEQGSILRPRSYTLHNVMKATLKSYGTLRPARSVILQNPAEPLDAGILCWNSCFKKIPRLKITKVSDNIHTSEPRM